MALQAVQKRSLPDDVFEQLTAEIVSGGYPPGATIPSERELSDVLGVNRHVVREAVKRLEQVGLVKVDQGGRTKVLDFRRSAGLDLLAILAAHPEPRDALLPLLGAALEMRAGIGVDVARLCAKRAGHELRAELPEIAEQLARADGRRAALTRPALLAGRPRRRRQPRLPARLQQPDPSRAHAPRLQRPMARAGAADGATTAGRSPPRSPPATPSPPPGSPVSRSHRPRTTLSPHRARPDRGVGHELRADPRLLPPRAHLQARRPHRSARLLAGVHGALLAPRGAGGVRCSPSAAGSTSVSGPGAISSSPSPCCSRRSPSWSG